MQTEEFRTGVIRPIECVKEAWELIKDEYWILFAVSMVGVLIGGISLYVLIGSMVCGIFGCYLKKIDGGRVVFDDLWKGFKYFWPSLLVTLVIVLPIVALFVIMFVTIYLPIITAAMMGNKANDTAILGTFVVGLIIDLVFTVIMVCIHSLLIFCFPLIVDRGLSSWDSMKLSARAVLKNLGGIVGVIGVNMLLGLAGYAVCGIGLYLAIPIITATNLVAYRKVFPRLNAQYQYQ
ncbi:MAG: hypothetical protein ABJB40_08405 [Acidobacteriota bacterium]